MCDKWDNLPVKVDHKLVQQTLMTFMRTNEEPGSGKSGAELAQMTALCEVGRLKISANGHKGNIF